MTTPRESTLTPGNSRPSSTDHHGGPGSGMIRPVSRTLVPLSLVVLDDSLLGIGPGVTDAETRSPIGTGPAAATGK